MNRFLWKIVGIMLFAGSIGGIFAFAQSPPPPQNDSDYWRAYAAQLEESWQSCNQAGIRMRLQWQSEQKKVQELQQRVKDLETEVAQKQEKVN